MGRAVTYPRIAVLMRCPQRVGTWHHLIICGHEDSQKPRVQRRDVELEPLEVSPLRTRWGGVEAQHRAEASRHNKS